jgi:D-sedoheptulose 7-phosphate isomerase
MSLADNVATITALANDLTYDEIFSQQLRNLVRKGDLVIAITGSGNSRNILNAVDVARRAGAYVFSLVGFDGGELAMMSDECLIIPSKNYGVIEDIHLAISHMLTLSIKKENNLIR